LASGGYIMRMSPIANGIFVVPFDIELMKLVLDGMKCPIPTPISIAKKIHAVRKRSRKPNFFL
jgi:hypothetical protein